MNEVQYERMQEAGAICEEAHRLVCDAFHVSIEDYPTEAALSHMVYKHTDCGAWVKINDRAEIVFGTIIEGSDAEIVCEPIPTTKPDPEDVIKRIDSTIAWLEDEAATLWDEAHR